MPMPHSCRFFFFYWLLIINMLQSVSSWCSYLELTAGIGPSVDIDFLLDTELNIWDLISSRILISAGYNVRMHFTTEHIIAEQFARVKCETEMLSWLTSYVNCNMWVLSLLWQMPSQLLVFLARAKWCWCTLKCSCIDNMLLYTIDVPSSIYCILIVCVAYILWYRCIRERECAVKPLTLTPSNTSLTYWWKRKASSHSCLSPTPLMYAELVLICCFAVYCYNLVTRWCSG